MKPIPLNPKPSVFYDGRSEKWRVLVPLQSQMTATIPRRGFGKLVSKDLRDSIEDFAQFVFRSGFGIPKKPKNLKPQAVERFG